MSEHLNTYSQFLKSPKMTPKMERRMVMSDELARAENSLAKPVVDEKMIRDFLFTSETKLTEKQQNMFMQVAIRHNLDPFKREIYAIAYGKEFSIVTGYQVYIERAEASGNLNGWSCENTESGAKIIIHRKDWEHPFEWEVAYTDFDKGIASWKTMRAFMIKKVCIGIGFRLAFPAELGTMPYLKEEMEGAKPFNSSSTKEPVKKAQAKTKGNISKARGYVTNISSKETSTNPLYIIRTKDAQFTTFDEKLATLAKSSMAVREADGDYSTEALEIDITYEDNDYNTIKEIDLVEG